MYAFGKNALAICDRCDRQVKYLDLVADGYIPKLRVCTNCRDTAHPAEKPFRVKEGIALRNPRPNRDDDTVVIASGTARAGAASTITLAAGAGSLVVPYIGQTITITGGTGSGQERTISGYNTSTKVARVSVAWTTPPDATSTYEITPSLVAAGLAFDHTFGGGT